MTFAPVLFYRDSNRFAVDLYVNAIVTSCLDLYGGHVLVGRLRHRMQTEISLEREIDAVRECIKRDWFDLASKDFDSDQRKATREQLSKNIATLQVLLMRNRLALQSLKLRRIQVVLAMTMGNRKH